ncbi:MAG: hypothetical protein R3C14_19810 [Caldilineaceae bacterium]
MVTGGSYLNPGFPTWGTMLREMGHQTHWFGKWHLAEASCPDLEVYDFGGGFKFYLPTVTQAEGD